MRVIAGSLGGRRLVAPRGSAVRPTSDRVRGAIANMLEAAVGLDGARVADVCCGTGALGIEALSRGAAHVEFVDSNRRSIDATRVNLEGVGLPAGRTKGRGTGSGASAPVTLTVADAVAWAGRADGPPFDLVLIDPPYAWDGWDGFLTAIVGRTALVVAESDREVTHPAWDVLKVRRYGGTVVNMLAAPGDPAVTDRTQFGPPEATVAPENTVSPDNTVAPDNTDPPENAGLGEAGGVPQAGGRTAVEAGDVE